MVMLQKILHKNSNPFYSPTELLYTARKYVPEITAIGAVVFGHYLSKLVYKSWKTPVIALLALPLSGYCAEKKYNRATKITQLFCLTLLMSVTAHYSRNKIISVCSEIKETIQFWKKGDLFQFAGSMHNTLSSATWGVGCQIAITSSLGEALGRALITSETGMIVEEKSSISKWDSRILYPLTPLLPSCLTTILPTSVGHSMQMYETIGALLKGEENKLTEGLEKLRSQIQTYKTILGLDLISDYKKRQINTLIVRCKEKQKLLIELALDQIHLLKNPQPFLNQQMEAYATLGLRHQEKLKSLLTPQVLTLRIEKSIIQIQNKLIKVEAKTLDFSKVHEEIYQLFLDITFLDKITKENKDSIDYGTSVTLLRNYLFPNNTKIRSKESMPSKPSYKDSVKTKKTNWQKKLPPLFQDVKKVNSAKNQKKEDEQYQLFLNLGGWGGAPIYQEIADLLGVTLDQDEIIEKLEKLKIGTVKDFKQQIIFPNGSFVHQRNSIMQLLRTYIITKQKDKYTTLSKNLTSSPVKKESTTVLFEYLLKTIAATPQFRFLSEGSRKKKLINLAFYSYHITYIALYALSAPRTFKYGFFITGVVSFLLPTWLIDSAIHPVLEKLNYYQKKFVESNSLFGRARLLNFYSSALRLRYNLFLSPGAIDYENHRDVEGGIIGSFLMGGFVVIQVKRIIVSLRHARNRKPNPIN